MALDTGTRTGRQHALPVAGHPSTRAQKVGLWEWSRQRQNMLLFVLGVVLFTLVAAWLSFIARLAVGDALSRTLSAVRVEHSRFPRLAAIGFIWPPLPTVAQLPLLLVPKLAFYGFSGGIISAIAAAGLLATLNRMLRWAEVTFWWRVPILLLCVLNPMWLFYAGNGMSEMPFLFFFTLAGFSFVRWQASGQWRNLIIGGLSTACMFGCRYDAIPYTAAFVIGICVVFIFGHLTFRPPRVEANLLAYLVPVTYAVGLWLYFNFLIQGDPIYFIRNPYSNNFIVRNVASNAAVLLLQSSWPATLGFFLVTLFALSPLLLVLSGVSLVEAVRRRNGGLAGVLLVMLAVPLFQLYSYRSGQTFGFLRFFLSVQPAGMLLVVALLPLWKGTARRMLLAATIVCLALGLWTTTEAMRKAGPGDIFADQVVFEETDFLRAVRHPLTPIDNYASARVAGLALRERFAGQPVTILGDISIDEVVLFSSMPRLFIGPSDPDFDQVLLAPVEHADYVLVTQPAAADPRYMALRQVYPKLYEDGLAGFVLDSQIGPYRLYRALHGGTS